MTIERIAKGKRTMHEMSLCESLVQVIEEQAKTQGFNKVKTVFVQIGTFAGIEVDALRFCFEVVCKGTLAESATLEIILSPGIAWCFNCEKEIHLLTRLAPCPECNGHSIRTKNTSDMRIKQLEVI